MKTNKKWFYLLNSKPPLNASTKRSTETPWTVQSTSIDYQSVSNQRNLRNFNLRNTVRESDLKNLNWNQLYSKVQKLHSKITKHIYNQLLINITKLNSKITNQIFWNYLVNF